MLSPGIVQPTELVLGFARGFSLRDYAGPALSVVQPEPHEEIRHG